MSDVPHIYTDSFEHELKTTLPDFVETYEDFQEGKVGFEFKDSWIELDANFAENAEPEFLRLLLKTLRRDDNTIAIKTTSQLKPILHTWATGIYGNKEKTETANEQNTAQMLLKRTQMLLSQKPLEQQQHKLSTSRIKTQYLKTVMDSFGIKGSTNTDATEINKQGETVYIRDIMHEDEVAGSIRYLESDSSVTILRSDVVPHLQGQGLGTAAYRAFIDEKISHGKTIQSDSIVSKVAQRIYRQLESDGYGLTTQPSRKKYREDLTTILPDTAREQQSQFPTVLQEGVRTTESGYRLKGEPVFAIHSSPNVEANISPIEINIIDTNAHGEMTYRIHPHKIEISQLSNEKLNSIAPDLHQQATSLLQQACDALTLPANQTAKDRLTADHISLWEVHAIERSDLEQALSPRQTLENGLER